MRWGDAVSPSLAARPGGVALWPVGATEQHGPHLPVDADTRISEAVSRLAAERVPDCVVLPGLPIGCSAAHTDHWPGTLALLPRTLIAVIVEVIPWLAASGWERVVIVNGHVGNAAPIRCAIDELRHVRPATRVATVNTWQLDPEVEAAFSDDASDWHANRAETSVVLALAPSLVGDTSGADDADRTVSSVFPWTVAATSRNGVTGLPSRATAAEGERLLDRMVAALVTLVRRAAVEGPPLSSPAAARVEVAG